MDIIDQATLQADRRLAWLAIREAIPEISALTILPITDDVPPHLQMLSTLARVVVIEYYVLEQDGYFEEAEE